MEVTVAGSSNNNGAISFSNSAPVIAVSQSQNITISGGSGTYYISSTSNPSILSVNISGSLLNLTGNSAGSSVITICQTGNSNCATLTATVGGSSTGSVYFSTSSLPAGTVAQAYSLQLSASGGSGGYTYSLLSGSLPAGLSLSGSGLLSGTPTVVVSGNISIKVTDSNGNSSTGNFTLTVNAASISVPTPTPTPVASTPPAGGYPNGELINENGTIYIVYQKTKVGFANADAFLGLGFNFANVTKVTNSGLAVSPKVVVTASGAHPRGTWLLSGKQVYFLTPAGLIPVPSWDIFLNNGGQGSFIVPANANDLSFSHLSNMTLNDPRMQ